MKERIGGVMVCVSTAGRSIRSTLRVRVVTYSVQLHPGVVVLMVVINHMRVLPHLQLCKSPHTTAHPLVGGCLLRMCIRHRMEPTNEYKRRALLNTFHVE